MAAQARSKISARTFFAYLVSLALLAFLVSSINWQDTIRILKDGVHPASLWPFSITALLIAVIYGCRWQLLIGGKLKKSTSLIASILCLGGNMFLPARGGDLLRVHYSHVVGRIAQAEVFGSLMVEKVIDLITIAAVGVLAAVILTLSMDSAHTNVLFVSISSALGLAFGAIVLVKYFNALLLRWASAVFSYFGHESFFNRHVAVLIRSVGEQMTLNNLFSPGILTLLMWLSAYALSYVFAAQFVGVALSYEEALVVLFAGALGLMLPAAPSGVGTFHASVVSAFLLLGRSSAEGFLVATAIHLLFFTAYVLPAAILYGRWRLARVLQS
ncbi:flippase-like domain-containing protein [Rhizobium sp. YTUHZ045]|uniref:lysylphosphatidylglycerol synthase transmembrane domain-containing protein n=1 Tax=Rhizobium sp. YTUHZ045 TaxID=2962888 RepID=UPI003DA93BCB